MKYAIVEDGGKQYKAVEGATIDVDHFPAESGEAVDLERVLLVADGETVAVGTPLVAGAKGNMFFLSSEEAAMRLVSPTLDLCWSPRGGEPVVSKLRTMKIIEPLTPR